MASSLQKQRTSSKRPIVGSQAVIRAVSLLKSFSDHQPEQSLQTLCRSTGLHKTTAHRLLAALESEGLIERAAGHGVYRLGPAMIALGGCAMRNNDLRTVARPVLEQIADKTGESTTLEVLFGRPPLHVLVLDEVVSSYLLGMTQDVGARLSAFTTSTGRLLLAHQPDAVRNALLAELPAAARTMVANGWQEALDCGHVTTVDELEVGFSAVAVPVRNHNGEVVAAISVGGPSVRLDAARLTELAAVLHEAAHAVSRQLGYGGRDGPR